MERPPGAPPRGDLPLLFYMPGIDGTGLAAYRQFPSLCARFDLRCLVVPPHDRTPFEELANDVAVRASRVPRGGAGGWGGGLGQGSRQGVGVL